jgi:hypothetical protein
MSQCTSFAKAAGPARVAQASVQRIAVSPFTGTPVGLRLHAGTPVAAKAQQVSGRSAAGLKVFAVKDGATLDRPLRVAVIGGGPSGACAAETLAKGGVEAFLIERKMDNCKVSARTPRPPPARTPAAARRRPAPVQHLLSRAGAPAGALISALSV